MSGWGILCDSKSAKTALRAVRPSASGGLGSYQQVNLSEPSGIGEYN